LRFLHCDGKTAHLLTPLLQFSGQKLSAQFDYLGESPDFIFLLKLSNGLPVTSQIEKLESDVLEPQN
jgi:hypothetical protein